MYEQRYRTEFEVRAALKGLHRFHICKLCKVRVYEVHQDSSPYGLGYCTRAADGAHQFDVFKDKVREADTPTDMAHTIRLLELIGEGHDVKQQLIWYLNKMGIEHKFGEFNIDE